MTGLRLRVGAGGRKAIDRPHSRWRQADNKTLGAYPVLTLATAREGAKKLLLHIATYGSVRVQHTFGQLTREWIEKVAKPKNRS